ncbi:response regulator [Allomuricauda taeanensis]|uniref:response regulator n=1 Tax=Flagellimonas taeanensis TaxID=1005926 RepID=UPI002E7AE2A3|nr:response regulator [Allomuricauda taeanensis]MEE1961072.1 response regulator [Allomuricauda taeanensis]
MDFIINNYQWIFSGIGVLILGWIVNIFFIKKKSRFNSSIIINNNLSSKPKNTSSLKKEKKSKDTCHILFIDDQHNDFKMVSILKKAGWINTKAIKDLTDLDDYKVKEADIIFVDINGVGTTMFEDQGLGLAAALKEKYKHKTVILYSAEPTGNRFNKKLRMVDNSLPKNAEPYEFISLIEQYS